MSDKLPSFQFYPGDWMKDPALRSVSVAARGLWMDLLCLMFECTERGVLARPNGEPYTAKDISRATGVPIRSVKRYVEELKLAGVCSFNIKDAITSRRQMRDHLKRLASNKRQAAYRNSRNLAQKGDADVTGGVTRMSHDSSSSSSSSTSVTKKNKKKKSVCVESEGKKKHPKAKIDSERPGWREGAKEVKPGVFLLPKEIEALRAIMKPKEVAYWVRAVAGYQDSNRREFNKKKNHYRCILVWQEKKLEKGLVWSEKDNGYRPKWQVDKEQQHPQPPPAARKVFRAKDSRPTESEQNFLELVKK